MKEKQISSEEIRHGINAFMLICREKDTQVLEYNFDTIQRTFRVSKMNISIVIKQSNQFLNIFNLVPVKLIFSGLFRIKKTK